MKQVLKFSLHLTLFGLIASVLSVSAIAQAKAQTKAAAPVISSHMAEVNGAKLHYLTAGHGSTNLILLHGYAETSNMWRPIMPLLAEKFTVIAPDLPGIGDSAIPANGLDMKSAATSIHALARSLGIQKAEVVGHDIGLMVAYAYAAQFQSETTKLVLMDAFLPGVGKWEDIYNNPAIWHFRFNGPTPELLVQGRERTYFEHYWNDFAADKTHSIPEASRKLYTAAYARPGRMRAGWSYFIAFPQTAKDFAQLAQTKLTMPVLSIGGEKANGAALGEEVKLVEKTIVYIAGSGMWDSAFETITNSFKTVNSAMAKLGLKANGPLMTIYTATDDTGFQFQAAVPVAQAPTMPAGSEIVVGKSPAGKALKFVHRGSYDAMDTTYEAITNYLDEKQLEAKDLFVEQYMKDPITTPEDDLVIEVYVPLK